MTIPDELILTFVAIIPALITGLLTYFTTRKRLEDDRAGNLFDDARNLAGDYKNAYKEATNDLHSLKNEIDGLRDEVQSLVKYGEMWRGVATQAYIEHGGDPDWWPIREPKPTGGTGT